MPEFTRLTGSFAAIDFETANSQLASICQAGVVIFSEGTIRDEWSSLVDPQDFFDSWNVSIHGIDQATVAGAPTFPQLFAEIENRLSGRVAVCHTYFDHAAMTQAVERWGLTAPVCRWLDSSRLVRRTWPSEFSERGYGLANVCAYLGLSCRHHDALEDARAAGEIVLKASKETGRDVDGLLAWLDECARYTFACEGNPEGLFYGETISFTGGLSLSRRAAAALASEAGCAVTDSVRKSTTLLVTGDQDLRKLAGHEKSSKHRKAEELRACGHSIRIIGESDFLSMLRRSGVNLPGRQGAAQ